MASSRKDIKKGTVMKKTSSSATIEDTRPSATAKSFVKDFHGVRYQVRDVSRAVAFYTGHLGFKLEHQHLPAFATISLGELDLLLSGPTASGSRPLPNGERQQPGCPRVPRRVRRAERQMNELSVSKKVL